jgi:hypothetical protein
MFVPNRITPPIWPALIRARRLRLAVVPLKATTSRWPTSCDSVGAAAGTLAWRVAPALA